jgi:hypothetical protein
MKVHKDKTGLYVVNRRRKFRPTGETKATKGDEVYGYTQDYNGRPDDVSIKKYEDTTSGAQSVGYDETWTTTDVHPQVKERLKEGQVNISLDRNPWTIAVVGQDGFNHRRFRRAPANNRSQTNSAGFNVLIPDALMLKWEQWDELVEKITEARSLVEIGPIALKLQEEVKAQDDLDEYLQKKGLV